MGCAHVVLAQVLAQPKMAVQSGSAGGRADWAGGRGTGLRQSVQCVSRVCAIPSGEAMAELTLQLTLEDFGPPSTQVGGAVHTGGWGSAQRWAELCMWLGDVLFSICLHSSVHQVWRGGEQSMCSGGGEQSMCSGGGE